MPKAAAQSRPAASSATASTTHRGTGPAAWRFIAVFALLIAGFYAFTTIPWFANRAFPANLQFNAQVSAWVLRVLGEDAIATDQTVFSPRFALLIRRGCEALEPSALFLAAVLAFPASWRRRLIGALLGIAALFILNIVRVVTLFYAGVHWPRAFETLHIEVWQTLFVLLAMAMWLAWAWHASADQITAGPTTQAERIFAKRVEHR